MLRLGGTRQLYRLRWEDEEIFKLIREFLQTEDFLGRPDPLIAQEIVAVHLYCLLARILIIESALAHDHGKNPRKSPRKPPSTPPPVSSTACGPARTTSWS
ncbi:MAG: hypothetical protein KKA60_01500 [Proteobacteria bacterium]|nr:hypothetical protein [Pseudomonadota bacterium]